MIGAQVSLAIPNKAKRSWFQLPSNNTLVSLQKRVTPSNWRSFLFLLAQRLLRCLQLTMQDKYLPYDLVVIGAGPHGLIAAHTWLEIYPESRVAILESEQEVG